MDLGAYGIHLSPYFSVLSALIFINAGYLAETFRGGFQSIPQTQYSAAKSLGMNNFKVYRYVILPQMFRRIYHPMTNQFVWSILMSSLGILVGMGELSGETQRLQSTSFRTLEFFIVAAAMYFVITKLVLFASSLIAKKVFKGEIIIMNLFTPLSWNDTGFILTGILNTVYISVVAIVVGSLLGLIGWLFKS